jgi:hypothetical protein
MKINNPPVYETGTWTPNLLFGGANAGMAYTIQEGSYFRFGRLVMLTAEVQLSAKGASAGVASISPLPFAITGRLIGFTLDLREAITYTGTPLAFLGNVSLALGYMTEGGVFSALNDTNFTNTSRLYISGHYVY